jgi:hypothetical protein
MNLTLQIRTSVIAITALLSIGVWGCEDILEEVDISEQQVVMTAPTEGSVVTQSQVSFSWETVEEATSYKVQVATPSFEQAAQVMVDTLVKVDSTFVGTFFSRKLDNAKYEWRVKAQNSGFATPYGMNASTVNAPEPTPDPQTGN